MISCRGSACHMFVRIRDPQQLTHRRKTGITTVGYGTSAEKRQNYICENNIVQKMLFLSDVSISKRRHKYIPQFFTSPMWPLSLGRLSVSKLHTCTHTHVHIQTHTRILSWRPFGSRASGPLMNEVLGSVRSSRFFAVSMFS